MTTTLTASSLKTCALDYDELNKRSSDLDNEQLVKKMRERFIKAGVPKMYWNAKLEDCDKRSIAWFNDKTVGLLLMGEWGVGKTHTACAMMNRHLSRKLGLFTTTTALFDDLRTTYNGQGDENEMLSRLYGCSFLIIDDWGKEKITEWNLSVMFKVIDRRLTNMRPTVITSNHSATELYSYMHDVDDKTAKAIMSRLQTYTTINLYGRDRRAS